MKIGDLVDVALGDGTFIPAKIAGFAGSSVAIIRDEGGREEQISISELTVSTGRTGR
jgi:hypothetical protein